MNSGLFQGDVPVKHERCRETCDGRFRAVARKGHIQEESIVAAQQCHEARSERTSIVRMRRTNDEHNATIARTGLWKWKLEEWQWRLTLEGYCTRQRRYSMFSKLHARLAGVETKKGRDRDLNAYFVGVETIDGDTTSEGL